MHGTCCDKLWHHFYEKPLWWVCIKIGKTKADIYVPKDEYNYYKWVNVKIKPIKTKHQDQAGLYSGRIIA